MYGLPADFDASPFVGRELTQVWFQKFTMQFIFGEGAESEIRVVLASAFDYQRAPDGPTARRDVPVMASNVTELIGRSVLKAKGAKNGTLSLSFEGGATLQFLDTLKKYESYQIIGIGAPIPLIKSDGTTAFQNRVIV